MLQGQKVLKTFILENQSTQHSQVIISPIDISTKEIDLTQIINKNIQNYQLSLFRIYDFRTNQYKKFDELGRKQYHVPKQFVNNGQAVVLIKYKYYNDEQKSSVKQSLSQSDDIREIVSDTSSLKKQRAKQRAISQVIQIVKRWRQLHLQKRGDKKISLQQAAKLVGLPKKSLDDYYYQLRLGEKYNFDFKSHLYQGIGCLRNFLKDKKPRLKSQASQKRPKNLKIIDQFDEMRIGSRFMAMQQQQQDNNNQQPQYHYQQQKKPQKQKAFYYNNNNQYNNNHNNYYNHHQQQQKQKQQIFQQPYYQMKEISNQQQQKYNNMFEQDRDNIQMKLQNQFYQDFGFMQSYQDPFINLDANFKKKKYENLFDQELFF